MLSALPPLSLYIHLPWCVRKCPYCDFNSHEAGKTVPERAYVAALLADLEQSLPLIWGRRIHTVFFGGGTPSLFSAEGINTLLEGIRARLSLDPFAEVTLEANPGAVDTRQFAALRESGINRLSLGIQSFNPRHLSALGRIHDDRDARQAAEAARRHFDNVNFDLIHALPLQTLEEAVADVDTALGFGPDHLSCYQLTLEPGTAFHRTPPPVPDEDSAYAIQEAVATTLDNAGFRHYETSAYARPGKECLHNLNYWRFGDYLGLGAGAHGKISFPDHILRQERWRNPSTYMGKVTEGRAVEREQAVPRQDIPFEFMMNALRLTEGFSRTLFEERTGMSLADIEEPLARAMKAGLLEREGEVLRPTRRGRDFLNDLLALFLPGE